MRLNRQVKAGIMLYALLMTAIFTLLLGLYLHRQEASLQEYKVYHKQTQAYALAHFSMQEMRKEKKATPTVKTYRYKEGEVSCQRQKDQVLVKVHLRTGEDYT